MKMLIATICDAAADNQGKLGILGTFDTINARGMPVVIPLCSIALRFMFSKVEEGSHKIRISIIDEDGKPIIKSIEGGMTVKSVSEEIMVKKGETILVPAVIDSVELLPEGSFNVLETYIPSQS